ncbi:MAG: helicase-related protein [Akkermansiaceae bacterium]|nr:helicase-related protein [Akkermansiaceae bacterium]
MPSNQSIYEVFEHQKADLLIHLLGVDSGDDQMVVFVCTLDVVHSLTSTLNHAGVVTQSLHAGKKEELRERVLREFHEGKTRVLVVTEGVARAIDFSGVKNMLHYDVAELRPDYLAHVDLTQQAGGQTITLVETQNLQVILKFEGLLGFDIPRKTAKGFVYDTQPVKVKPPRKKGGVAKGIRSRPLQNKKPKYKVKGRGK